MPFDVAAAENSLKLQAGAYSASIWFKLITGYLEAQFPGVGEILEQASVLIPWTKLWQAIQTALTEYQQGSDFLTIFKEVLSEWLEIKESNTNGPIRMAVRRS